MIIAKNVEATDDFFIFIDLLDGRKLKLDMNFIKNETGHVVQAIQDIEAFKQVFIRNGIVTWPSGYDIDPYYLESEGIEINSKTA